jgi:hypothetical protein
MKTFIGISIDRKKAVIVTKKRPDRNYEKDVEIAIAQTRSDVEGKVRLAGGSRTRNVPWGQQDRSPAKTAA